MHCPSVLLTADWNIVRKRLGRPGAGQEAIMFPFARGNVAEQFDLWTAHRQHEFDTWFQPVVSTETAMVCGAEALLRWRLPSGQMLNAGQFAASAEYCGLMTILSTQALTEACAHCAVVGDGPRLRVASERFVGPNQQPAIRQCRTNEPC